MAFELTYDAQNQCLLAVMSGKILDLQTLRDYSLQIVDFMRQHPECKRYINDLSSAEFFLPVIDIIRLPNVHTSVGMDPSWKRAVVVKEWNEEFDLYEKAVINRGFDLRIFTDRIRAKEWIVTC